MRELDEVGVRVPVHVVVGIGVGGGCPYERAEDGARRRVIHEVLSEFAQRLLGIVAALA